MPMCSRTRPVWLACLLLSVLWTAPAGAASLEHQFQQMLRAHDLRETRVAVMVQDLSTGRVLARLRADEPMIPASNMKLITTSAALDVLGPEFVFRTELSRVDHNGERVLVVRADGDPAFGDPVLLEKHDFKVEQIIDRWVQAVADTGVKQFDKLVIDDRVFDRQFVHPTWPEGQLNRSYCAEVAGLNFYQNCIDVRLIPAAQRGQAPEPQIFPPVPFIETTNKATTGGKDAYWISRARTANKFTFHGTVRNRPVQPTQVTVHDPPIFFGKLLADRLKKQAGVTIDQVTRPADDTMLPMGTALHRMQTTLPVVLERVNRDSQNMFAEALIKRMGRAMTGAAGSWENGAAAVRVSLRRRLGPGSRAVNIADGSGMSRKNRVTAKIIVQLLASMHRDKEKGELFRGSLAEAGETGTLDDRLTELEPTLLGKSGYLRSVSALSGYLQLPDGDSDEQPRTVAFSFLFNGFKPPLYNPQMKSIQNKMVRTIVEALTPKNQLGG